jgi:hypothetical protein
MPRPIFTCKPMGQAMGTKAKSKHTRPATVEKMAAQLPLDDDARWLPIEAAHHRGVERTGDNDLADIDLEKLLAEGRLPCMRRSITSEERVRVAAIAWTDLIRLYSGKEVRVIYRKPLSQTKGHYIVNPVRGWRFFVWQPVLDRIWPPPAGSAPVDHDDASDTPPRVKSGPKPRRNWPMLIEQWLNEVQTEDPDFKMQISMS